MAAVQPLSWGQRAWHSFVESNYVTDAWNWLLKFLSKSAEPILFFTVLYSGYELLPGVPQPGAIIDAPVFIAQQAALDIGGLGLMKIAKQVQLGKDSYAYRVGMVLIGLMMANVAMASLKKVVPLPPLASTIVETILLMARAIMAVLYGHAIHSLRDDHPQIVSQAAPPSPDLTQITRDLEQKIGQQFATRIAELEARLEAQIAQPGAQESGKSEDDQQAENGQEDGQKTGNNITILRAPGQAKRQARKGTSGTFTKAQRAARYIRDNPQITAPLLAQKAGIDVSYARRLLSAHAEKNAVNE